MNQPYLPEHLRVWCTLYLIVDCFTTGYFVFLEKISLYEFFFKKILGYSYIKRVKGVVVTVGIIK